MIQVASILFGALFTAAISLTAGKLLFRSLNLKLHSEEEHLLGFVLGSACLSLLVFLLASLGLLYWWLLLIAGCLVLWLGIRRGAHRPSGEPLPPLPMLWKWIFAAVFAVFTVLYLSNAMAPEMSPDGSTYHLGVVSRYLREHGFHLIGSNMYASLSQGVEMLFLFAFAFGRHSAAAMVHFCFLIALALLLLSYGRRIGRPAAGVVGALLVYASPVVGIDGISAYNDVATACIVFSVFYLVHVWDEQRDSSLLIPIGLAAGYCYAAKYVAFLGVPYALGFVAWRLRREGKEVWRPLAVIAMCAGVLILPWMAKNYILMGNPLAPFFNRLYPNPYTTPAFELEYTLQLMNYGNLPSRWMIPWEALVRGDRLVGLLGPLFLLTPLSLLALRERTGRRLLFAAFLLLATYPTNLGTRFLLFALPFFALALGLVFSRWKYVAVAAVLVHAVLSWPTVTGKYCAEYAWRLHKVPWKGALRIWSEEEFMQSNFPLYAVSRMIERYVPPGRRVFTFTQVPDAYTSREILVGYQAASNSVIADILICPIVSDFQPTWRHTVDFPPQRFKKLRVYQTGRANRDTYWSVSEFHIYSQGAELPRESIWRLRANPNPWDVQLAFDNSPVTRWRSAQTMGPGMFIEVDFGMPLEADRVVLDCTRDEYAMRLWLEGQEENGRWRMLSENSTESTRVAPLALARRAAREVKSRGVDYLLFYVNDRWANEFTKREKDYGLTLVARTVDASLYRIE